MWPLGENLKRANKSRAILLLVIAVAWRIVSEGDFSDLLGDPYIYPVIGFFMVATIVGELTRKFISILPFKTTTEPINERHKDQLEDTAALNFGIMWGFIYLLLVLFINYHH